MMLERSKIVLPTPELWPIGIDEMEAFEYSVTDSGTVRTSAPSGVHDDCVVALALAAWQMRIPPAPPRIHCFRDFDSMSRFLNRARRIST